MGLLEGRLAVITAGTAGIGRAVAPRFVAEGADVVVTSPFQAELDETASALGPRVTGVRGDASELADLDALARPCGRSAARSTCSSSTPGGTCPRRRSWT